VTLVERSADEPNRLFRCGLAWESRERLAEQAAVAKHHGLPHGVSVFSRSSRDDAVSADRMKVTEVFAVHKTAKNPYHFTVELPEPVTDSVVDTFNRLFGRSKP
jgi:hypothetical protein